MLLEEEQGEVALEVEEFPDLAEEQVALGQGEDVSDSFFILISFNLMPKR